jgi:hypothetical protein
MLDLHYGAIIQGESCIPLQPHGAIHSVPSFSFPTPDPLSPDAKRSQVFQLEHYNIKGDKRCRYLPET